MSFQRLPRRHVVVRASSSVFRPTVHPWNGGGVPPPSLLEVKEAWQVARSLERRIDRADYLFGEGLDLNCIETHLPIVEALERQYRQSPPRWMRVDLCAQVMVERIASYLLTAYVVVMFLWSCLRDEEEAETDDDEADDDDYVL